MKQYLKDLIKRKDLLLYLVSSGLKAQHRNTLLGYFWWLLDPLLNVFIYYFIVVIIFKSGSTGYGPYLVVGMIAWRWTSSTVSSASKAIVSQAGIISQVYLPKAIFAFGATLTQLINFGFGLLVIAIFLIFFQIIPGAVLLWLPFIVSMQLLFMLAISLILAFVCVFFRDIDNIVNHLMRLWFFGSPVIWEVRLLPERVRWFMDLNPMTHFLTSYRNVFIYKTEPLFVPLLVIGGISFIFIVFMLSLYNQHEHKIIKVL